MYCINYGSFDYGQGRSGRLSQKRHPSTQRSSLVRIVSCVPRGILTDVCTATLPPQAVDTSLPPAELIADSVKRSSRAHMFHFYSLLCEIASVQRKAPSGWISADRLAVLSGAPAEKEKEMETAPTGRNHHPSSSRLGPGRLVSLDARELARECLKEVGRELGVRR